MNQPWVYMCSPSWTPLPPPSPSHPSGSSQGTILVNELSEIHKGKIDRWPLLRWGKGIMRAFGGLKKATISVTFEKLWKSGFQLSCCWRHIATGPHCLPLHGLDAFRGITAEPHRGGLSTREGGAWMACWAQSHGVRCRRGTVSVTWQWAVTAHLRHGRSGSLGLGLLRPREWGCPVLENPGGLC